MPEELYKIYKHNPPHLFRPNSKYFITAGIYRKKILLRSDESKERLLKSLSRGCKDFGFELEDWVILDNHYHVMISSSEKDVFLDKLFREVHKFTALWIKKNISDAQKEAKIFHNYWDSCIDHENSYFARLNYIYYNPVKHGYVDYPEEYKFGSYYYRIGSEKKLLDHLRRSYPFGGLTIQDDF